MLGEVVGYQRQTFTTPGYSYKIWSASLCVGGWDDYGGPHGAYFNLSQYDVVTPVIRTIAHLNLD